jgi:ubiquinone/menaquinone biosynthesis C-methylase UbiE
MTLQALRATALKTAFTLLYYPFAWAYDWVSGTFFAGQWRVWQRAALAYLPPGGPVLELGCGTGDLQIDLRALGVAAVGMDLSPAMLRVARRKAGAAPFWLARARSQALPFPSGHFAAVVSTFPSDYIFDPATLAEVARVLAPGGRLIIVPVGALLPTDAPTRLLDSVARLAYGQPRPPADPAARRASWIAAFRQRTAFGPLVSRLQAAGFHTQAHVGASARSVVLVLVAEKREA